MNPDLANRIKGQANENLDKLSVEYIHTWIHETILPLMGEEDQAESLDTEQTVESILSQFGLKNLHMETVPTWLHQLGFRYRPHKKSYYVDGHEKPDTVTYQKNFIKRYLCEYEPQMFRWVQVKQTKVEALELEEKIPKGKGYRYKGTTDDEQEHMGDCCDEEQDNMVEFHIDALPEEVVEELAAADNALVGPFGSGRLSVCRDRSKKPLICLGQDECIFKQFSFFTKVWYGSDGQLALLPKDEGMGVMISAFQSRELGFGFWKLSADELAQVNHSQSRKEYLDKEAAIRVRKHPRKEPLMEHNFVQYFEYGKENEGYWTYDYMVLQLEDCVDVLKVAFGDRYDFLFLFDHSCGHDRKRDDALCATDMSKEFGGKQSKLRSTRLTKKCLGTYAHDKKLKVDDVQLMIGGATGDGPFWLNPTERELQRFDKPAVTRTNLKMVVLKSKLREANIPFASVKKLSDLAELATANGIAAFTESPKMSKEYFTVKVLRQKLDDAGVGHGGAGVTKKGLQKRCQDHGLPHFIVKQVVDKGWVGKPKGILQVLWERGFIDPEDEKYKQYTMSGPKDKHGHVDKGYSLVALMENCEDYTEELTLVQHCGKAMGITVDRTPKCHAELAGEGIEYSWGFSKQRFCKNPIALRRKKNDFLGLVKKCLDREESLTNKLVRKFSRRARAYMVAYYTVHFSSDSEHQELENEEQASVVVKVERLMKHYKSHRSATDFETKFIDISEE
jgi:transposase